MDKQKVMQFLKTDEGKKLLQPKLDKHFTKGLQTWKQNNLQTLIEQREQAKMTDDERHELKLKEMQQQLDMKKQVKALKMKCDETGLDAFTPVDELVNVLATLDNEQAVRTIVSLAEHFNTIFHDLLSKEVNARIGDTTPRNDGQTGQDSGGFTREQLLKLPYEERAKFFQQNPDHYRFIMQS